MNGFYPPESPLIWTTDIFPEPFMNNNSILIEEPLSLENCNNFLNFCIIEPDPDGMEVEGWENNIIDGAKKTRIYTIPKELSRSNPARWSVDSFDVDHDPSTAVFIWSSMDTDLDLLNDFDEFQNSSNPLLIDTDSDFIFDFEESSGNHTQKDADDPQIDGKINVRFEDTWTKNDWGLPVKETYVSVSYRCIDNAGLDYSEIGYGKPLEVALGAVKYVKFVFGDVDSEVTDLDGNAIKVPARAGPVNYEFKADLAGAWITGYDIAVRIADVNGMGISGHVHLDSSLQGFVNKILADLMSLIKKIAELASQFFNWIWGLINEMLEPFLKPIIESARYLSQNIVDLFLSCFGNIQPIEGRQNPPKMQNSLFGLMLSSSLIRYSFQMSMLVFALQFIIMVIMTVVGGGMGKAIGDAISKVMLPSLKEMAMKVVAKKLEIAKYLASFIIGITAGSLLQLFIQAFLPNIASSLIIETLPGIAILILIIFKSIDVVYGGSAIPLKMTFGNNLSGIMEEGKDIMYLMYMILFGAIVSFISNLLKIWINSASTKDKDLYKAVVAIFAIITLILGAFIVYSSFANEDRFEGEMGWVGKLDEAFNLFIFGYSIAQWAVVLMS